LTAIEYRPFVRKEVYYDTDLIQRNYQWSNCFRPDSPNSFIAINSPGNTKEFHTLCSHTIIDLHYTGDSQVLPLYRYTSTGERIDNITDWALELFNNHYRNNKKENSLVIPGSEEPDTTTQRSLVPRDDNSNRPITKEDIFHYVYAVLHHPAYRKKYELNLKREFPRIPLYDDFWKWSRWGKELMKLHINYETVEPYSLTHVVMTYMVENESQLAALQKPKLKADKVNNKIIIDGFDELKDIPSIAWEYKLGNRSALEWILDQYKEKKPTDPTIAEKFNTYRFADYKDKVINLLKRVCTVSVETMKIINQMPEL
jgi:predicted helicase